MMTYDEAIAYSEHNPDELVEFKTVLGTKGNDWTGFFLNGKLEGIEEVHYDSVLKKRGIYDSKKQHEEHKMFSPYGSIIRHYFGSDNGMHGECKAFNEDGLVIIHRFYKSNKHIEELDYLINEERNEAFYVTLALYDIDKEYTIGA